MSTIVADPGGGPATVGRWHNDTVTDPTPPAGPLPDEIARVLKRDAAGLVAAVVQDHATRDVLMVGWMDDEALRRTLSEGRVTFWSRSRGEYWRKGDTSGHAQFVREVRLDCDGDALLVVVDQVGAACHTGTWSCFTRDLPAVTGATAPRPTPARPTHPTRPTERAPR